MLNNCDGNCSSPETVVGEERRKNVREALIAIDDQIRPVLKRKKYQESLLLTTEQQIENLEQLVCAGAGVFQPGAR